MNQLASLSCVIANHTARLPFYPGEVYHQNHCNFFPSEGMPYPDWYTVDLYRALKASGRFAPTSCPEQPWTHNTCGAGRFGRARS